MPRYRPAVCLLAMLALVPAAPARGATAAGGGGAAAPGAPRISQVSCLGSISGACRGRSTVVRGNEFVVRGSSLTRVTRVIFGGARTRRDDVAARITRSAGRYAVGVVPARARSGPLVLLTGRAIRVARVSYVRVNRAPKVAPLDVTPANSYFWGGRRRATFRFTASRATTATVELVNEDSQAVVRSWSVPATPGTPAAVSWDGKGSDGSIQRPGRYSFRLASGAGVARVASDAATRFFFADYIFPIRGKHNLGYTPTNNFGGGGRRKHMGQDMFAKCGTKEAAVRAGRIQYAGYDGNAGNYVVLDAAGTGEDFVYMHMLKTPMVKTGDRVFTGQAIGLVGESGRASGCHLHFERWTSPGWYEGGRAIDPLPALKVWDSYS